MPGGVQFSQEVFTHICSEIALGRSLRSVCREDWAPSITAVMEWLAATPALVEQYTRAKDDSADAMADDILDIADESASALTSEQVQAARLRVDARKWIAAKLKPKKYGDRLHNEHSGPGGAPIQVITGVPLPPDHA